MEMNISKQVRIAAVNAATEMARAAAERGGYVPTVEETVSNAKRFYRYLETGE